MRIMMPKTYVKVENNLVKRLIREHNELVEANLLEGDDPMLRKWLYRRKKIIVRFSKKLYNLDDSDGVIWECVDNLGYVFGTDPYRFMFRLELK